MWYAFLVAHVGAGVCGQVHSGYSWCNGARVGATCRPMEHVSAGSTSPPQCRQIRSAHNKEAADPSDRGAPPTDRPLAFAT